MDEHGCEKLPTTVVAQTPSGGFHYFWRYGDNVKITNSHRLNEALNLPDAGLDVRGSGGQVNVAPTVRGEGEYRWVPGRAPGEVEVADAPGWLLELVVERPRPVTQEVPAITEVLTGTPDYVEAFNRNHPGEQLLTADGWTMDARGPDSKGVTQWSHPNKDPREGTSASTNHRGTDRLWMFSSSIPALPANSPKKPSYDKYGYVCRMHMNGDFRAMAKKYGTQSSPTTTSPTPVVAVPEEPAWATSADSGAAASPDHCPQEVRRVQLRSPGHRHGVVRHAHLGVRGRRLHPVPRHHLGDEAVRQVPTPRAARDVDPAPCDDRHPERSSRVPQGRPRLPDHPPR